METAETLLSLPLDFMTSNLLLVMKKVYIIYLIQIKVFLLILLSWIKYCATFPKTSFKISYVTRMIHEYVDPSSFLCTVTLLSSFLVTWVERKVTTLTYTHECFHKEKHTTIQSHSYTNSYLWIICVYVHVYVSLLSHIWRSVCESFLFLSKALLFLLFKWCKVILLEVFCSNFSLDDKL